MVPTPQLLEPDQCQDFWTVSGFQAGQHTSTCNASMRMMVVMQSCCCSRAKAHDEIMMRCTGQNGLQWLVKRPKGRQPWLKMLSVEDLRAHQDLRQPASFQQPWRLGICSGSKLKPSQTACWPARGGVWCWPCWSGRLQTLCTGQLVSQPAQPHLGSPH